MTKEHNSIQSDFSFQILPVIEKRVFRMGIVCPITNTDRGFPFHVPVPENSKLSGFIMVEQVKSVDFRSRRVKRIEDNNEEMSSVETRQ